MDRFWVLDQFVAKMNDKYGPTTSILPEPYVQSYMIYAVIKAAMEILGLKGGSVRLPLINLRDEDRKELERILFEVFGLEKIGKIRAAHPKHLSSLQKESSTSRCSAEDDRSPVP